MLRKLGSILLASLLASSLAAPAAAAPDGGAPDQTVPERARLFEALAVAPDDMPLGEGTASREYFVRLAGAPAALNTGRDVGTSVATATRDAVTGELSFRADAVATQTYRESLTTEQAEVATDGAVATVGRELEILGSFTVANHGFATVMTPDEARELANHPDVVWVEELPEVFPTTDRGPAFVNARGGQIDGNDGVWTRPDDGAAEGTTGAGVVVGIIDTGINPASPSFQALSDDGHPHQNPRGDQFYGSCDPDNDGQPREDSIYAELELPPDAAPYDEDLAEWCNGKLIGMWGYHSVTGVFDEDTGERLEDGTPIDWDGHGSHVAGTAAGGFADGIEADTDGVDVTGNDFDVSGVAPHASIISYGACCSTIAILHALDQIIVDDVDVMNFSIGTAAPTADLLGNVFTFGFLAARANGIHVATSAGNDGPGPESITGPADAPWATTAASSTHDRIALNALTGLPEEVFTDGRIDGKGVSDALEDAAPIVYAGDLDPPNPLCRWNEDDDEDEPTIWNEDDAEGLIVVCDRGANARTEKAEVAEAAGAVGFVHANDEINQGAVSASLNGDAFVIPGVHITYEDGVALKDWLADLEEDPTGTIEGTSFDVDDAWGDVVSIFSSRGPNGANASLIGPDVTAPGTDVLAPYGSDNSTEYQFISGTSMSSPHTAGSLALLVDGFGDDALTPAEAQSALALTARGGVLKTDGVTPADPHDVGSGHVDVAAALATGIVLDTTIEEYIDTFLLDLDPADLNVASLVQSQCVDTCAWQRTFTGTANADEVTYTVEASAEDFDLSVDEATITVSDGEEATITVTADVAAGDHGQDLFGVVTLTSDDPEVSDASLPVVVRPVPFGGPDRLEIESEGYVDQASFEYSAANATDLDIAAFGLVSGEIDELELAQDPTRDQIYTDIDPDGVLWLQVGENDRRLVAEIVDTLAVDIDLFVGRDANGDQEPQASEELCRSAGAGWDEYCEVLDPEPGDYWVLVQNWQASAQGAVDPVTAVTAVVGSQLEDFVVEYPASVVPGDTFDLDLRWDLVPFDKHWYGVLEFGSTPDDVGEFVVPVDVVVVPEPPVAEAGGPYRVTLGEQVTLEGSASDHPEGLSIESYSWDVSQLGIASPQSGETLTVTPTVAGEHTVTLTVVVDGVEATDTAVVEVVVGSTPPPPPPACDAIAPVGFPDVQVVPPHGDNIGCVAGFGIAEGRADGNYVPRGEVRRDQMASFIARTLRVAGVELPASPDSSFPDVTSGPHVTTIGQLADLGIVEGRTPDRYDPNASVTRAQMASFIIRALEVALERDLTPSGSGPFTDIGGPPHSDNIRVAAELGIAEGRTPTTFEPNNTVRRDQMASFIARSLGVLEDEGLELTPIR